MPSPRFCFLWNAVSLQSCLQNSISAQSQYAITVILGPILLRMTICSHKVYPREPSSCVRVGLKQTGKIGVVKTVGIRSFFNHMDSDQF